MRCPKCNLEIKNKGGFSIHEKTCILNESLIREIREKYKEGLSIIILGNLYNISKGIIIRVIKDIRRGRSDASIMAHKKYPERYVVSEETKDKIRQARLKWMKDNPEKTAWRKSNLSHPEKIFQNKIIEVGLDKKHLIIRERSIFPYFIDFAFEEEKIAVEIDGSQHEKIERKEADDKKDKLLTDMGWVVIRFGASKVQKNIIECIDYLNKYLSNRSTICGIYTHKDYKENILKKIDENGFTQGERDSQTNQRKSIRPPYQQLLLEIQEFGYRGAGKKYNVSDNAIRKWVKMYEKYGDNF